MSTQVIPIFGTPFDLTIEFANDKYVFIEIRKDGQRQKSYTVSTKLFNYLDYYEQFIREKGVFLD